MSTQTQPKPAAAPATLRSRYIVANGVRTHYTEAGDNGPNHNARSSAGQAAGRGSTPA